LNLIIRSRLLENLRMLPHAPGVQMADIPEDSIDINQDELRDTANPDTRVSSIMKVGQILSRDLEKPC
jgi:hypothetical protein